MTWRLRELLTEARSGIGPRGIAVGLIALTGLAAAATVSGMQAEGAIRQENSLRRDGSLVVAVQYRDGEDMERQRPLKGRDCERLNGLGGVQAAGGILLERPPAPVPFPEGPGIPALHVTPHALTVWQAEAPMDEIVIGPDLEDLGTVTVGTALIWDAGPAYQVGSRADAYIPHSGLRSAVMIPHHADANLSECWIKVSPGNQRLGLELATAVFSQAQVEIVPWLTAQTQTLSPTQQWHAFVDWHPWFAVAVFLALVIFVITWSRRSEMAVYRAFGTTNGELTLLITAETAVVLLPAALVACAISVTVTAGLADGTIPTDLASVIVRILGSTTLLTLGLTPVAARLAIRGTIADQLKDR
ncbi:MAG: hypothetical protein FWD59_05920 [Micrococcales bacterium]|nr:hypothetical protein [Micrococcales bacterium]